MFFIYFSELYEAEFRSSAQSMVWGISKVAVIFIPQYVYLVKDQLGLNVLTGTISVNLIAVIILTKMPETIGTNIDLKKK